MYNRVLFFDESGKTGTQKYVDEWNFVNQPYFALCGILIPENNINELNQIVEDLRNKYKIQGEIKATKNSVQKNRDAILAELWNVQENYQCELFIEIVNKRFCIAMMITNYCIFPYYDVPPEFYSSYDACVLRKNFANYVYDFISDKLLSEFVDFFDNNSQEINVFKQLCCKLIKETGNQEIVQCINETIDSINNFELLNLLQHNLFPLVDYYKGKGSTVAICPQIDSFNNILNRIGHIDGVTLVHDNLVDLGEALQQTIKDRKLSNELCFENSKKNSLLQLTDLWCGSVNEAIHRIIEGGASGNDVIQNVIQNRVNFVSTFKEQKLIFPDNEEIKLFDIWYKDYY